MMAEDSRGGERFMASEGLVQWTQGVATQAQRVSVAQSALTSSEGMRDAATRRLILLNFHSECHHFAIAADMFSEFRKRARDLGLFASVDFSEIDSFPWRDHKDVRNMREHIAEYLAGKGRDRDRWVVETPHFKADASSVVGTLIGGRLDWVGLGAAAERLLPRLLAEPIPYPPARSA
jgi:hypothetical protein